MNGRKIPEADWKKLRKLNEQLLASACEKIFEKLKPIVEVTGQGSHQAYLRLWKTLKKEDADLSTMFDDIKRSTAFFTLAAWRNNGLLSDEDLSNFSQETQEIVNLISNA